MNKARPRTPFTRVDKGTHQHNPNMHGKSFSVPATSRQDLAKRSGQHARDCEYWITSVVRGRPLKDLFNYFLLLDITFLRNYWTVLNENDYFPRLDTMDKLKKTGTDTGSEQHEDWICCGADKRNRMIRSKLLFGAWLRMNIHHWWAGRSEKP